MARQLRAFGCWWLYAWAMERCQGRRLLARNSVPTEGTGRGCKTDLRGG